MIKLRDLLNEEFTAVSSKSGKTVAFDTKDARDAAVKAGTHEVPEDEKGGKDEPKGEKPNMFSKDAGYDAPDAKKDEPKSEPSKYDDSSFWKDDEKSDSTGIDHYDGDTGDFYDDDDDYDSYDDDSIQGVRKTTERLDKVETALNDELKLRDNGFTTGRSSGGGGGSFEGPLTIYADGADFDNPNYAELSIGSPQNDGTFSIVFADADGMPLFEPNYDALTGDKELSSEESYKIGKALMKMPEVQKFLKGGMSRDEFEPIYNKLKGKFSKSSNEGTIKLMNLLRK